MTKYRIQIANQVATINTVSENIRNVCKDYLTRRESEFSVNITQEDIAFERNKAMREDTLERLPIRNLSDTQLEFTAIQRKITEEFFSRNILLFHGSVIAVDGRAYLFTAKSGTGKSTHTRLWRELLGDRAVMVNDDKPFLQMTEDGVVAWGSPWNGKHRLGNNIGVPLKAICILERGTDNRIRRITPAEALPMLFQQSSRPMDPAKMPQYLDMIDKLTKRVEFYRLQCNMDPEAALVSYEAMSRERKDDR